MFAEVDNTVEYCSLKNGVLQFFLVGDHLTIHEILKYFIKNFRKYFHTCHFFVTFTPSNLKVNYAKRINDVL